jgi:uncharacterized protein YecT (DUF1311 family)
MRVMLMLALAMAAESVDCRNAQTQMAMTECAGRDANAADAALNRQYAITMAAMKKADMGLDRKTDKDISYSAALLAAQRAWVVFRDAECRSEAFGMRGGSAQPMLAYGCAATLTRTRIAQLKQLVPQH